MNSVARYFVLYLLLGTGCIKNERGCLNISPKDEEVKMLSFASDNGIIVEKHNTGMYYQIISPGSGMFPQENSRIKVTYKGAFLNGNLFDKTDTAVTFLLNTRIEGWIVGIPLISKGGKIKLIIPSSMAYGCNGARTIPPNSILYFDVDLLDVE